MQQQLRMAMAWHGTKHRTTNPLQIQRRPVVGTAARLELGAQAKELLEGLIETTPRVIGAGTAQLPGGYHSAVAEAILKGPRASAHQLKEHGDQR